LANLDTIYFETKLLLIFAQNYVVSLKTGCMTVQLKCGVNIVENANIWGSITNNQFYRF